MLLAPPWTLTDREWLAHIWIDMSRRRQHSLISHLETLLMHLLQWQYQPVGRQWGHSWVDTIRETQRDTGLPRATFPQTCPWTAAQIDDRDNSAAHIDEPGN